MKVNLYKRFYNEVYNIGFIQKGLDAVMYDGVQKGDIIWLNHPYKDRFFADPFLVDSDEQYYYVACEEFLFFEEKGKITLLKINKESLSLKERMVLIEEDTHLSFPYCKYGEYVFTPESSASGKCIRYTVDKMTYQIVKKEIILNEGLIDSIFYNDTYDWIYSGKLKIPSTELYAYKKERKTYKPCPERPIISDNRQARSAGDFFKWKGKIYRPVQDCKGRYGRQTKIMEMKSIGEEGYIAEEYKTLNSFENPPYNLTMHTFNVYDDVILVDGSNDFSYFPVKILYKLFPFIFSKRLHEKMDRLDEQQ